MTSAGTVVSYPISAYQNVPIEPQFFQPSQFVISAVTLGIQTIVTTTTNMNYVIGQLVRLLIPSPYGCYQLNQQTGYVLAIPAANQVTLSIDSSQNVDPYIAAAPVTPSPYVPSTANTPAQIVAVGDVNTGYSSSTGVNIPLVTVPGAFINISPN